jgi:hypothetical protein
MVGGVDADARVGVDADTLTLLSIPYPHNCLFSV